MYFNEIQYERDESWTETLQETIMMVFNHVEPGLSILPPSLWIEHYPHQQSILKLIVIFHKGKRKLIISSLQQEYDEAIHIITEALDTVESIKNKQMLLTGDTIIEIDIRLFVTLIRFNDIYHVHFKENTRKILVMTSV